MVNKHSHTMFSARRGIMYTAPPSTDTKTDDDPEAEPTKTPTTQLSND